MPASLAATTSDGDTTSPPGNCKSLSGSCGNRERRPSANYRHLGEPIHLIGVEFSRQTRNVTAFAVAADQT